MNAARNHLLLIEDDPWVADYIADVVEAFFAFRVLRAETAEAARARFYANSDLLAAVISDLTLGSTSGLALVRDLVGSRSEIAIVFVTGHVENERDLSTRVGRPVSLLMKPFNPVDLKCALETRLAADTAIDVLHTQRL